MPACACMCVHMWGACACHGAHVEVRAQLSRVGLSFHPDFKGAKSGHQLLVTSAFTH